MAKDVVYVMPGGSPMVNKTRLTEAYYKKASLAIIKQFMKASVRLAYLLDRRLGQIASVLNKESLKYLINFNLFLYHFEIYNYCISFNYLLSAFLPVK